MLSLRSDSNRRDGFCRPAPSHSDTKTLRKVAYSKRTPEGAIGLANRVDHLVDLLSVEEGGGPAPQTRRSAPLSRRARLLGRFTFHRGKRRARFPDPKVRNGFQPCPGPARFSFRGGRRRSRLSRLEGACRFQGGAGPCPVHLPLRVVEVTIPRRQFWRLPSYH